DVVIPDSEDGAVSARGDLEMVDLFARLICRQQIFASILDPADGAADPPGEERDDQLLAIEAVFDAEATADVRRDHPNGMLRHSEHVGEHSPCRVRRLRRVPDVQLLAALAPLVARDDPARLERLAAEPPKAEVESDHY